MTTTHKFTIYGAPRTKKNSAVWTGKRLVQNKAYKAYEKSATDQLLKQNCIRRVALSKPVSVKVLYYLPDHKRRDLSNLMEGTADILQGTGIISDDVIIDNWDGSRIAGVDKENPRAEIEIKEGIKSVLPDCFPTVFEESE